MRSLAPRETEVTTAGKKKLRPDVGHPIGTYGMPGNRRTYLVVEGIRPASLGCFGFVESHGVGVFDPTGRIVFLALQKPPLVLGYLLHQRLDACAHLLRARVIHLSDYQCLGVLIIAFVQDGSGFDSLCPDVPASHDCHPCQNRVDASNIIRRVRRIRADNRYFTVTGD